MKTTYHFTYRVLETGEVKVIHPIVDESEDPYEVFYDIVKPDVEILEMKSGEKYTNNN